MLEGQNQDPDYDEAAPPDRKRLKYLEENGYLVNINSHCSQYIDKPLVFIF